MAMKKIKTAIWAFTEAIVRNYSFSYLLFARYVYSYSVFLYFSFFRAKRPAATYDRFRSICHLKVNNFEAAVEDLRSSIQNDPKEISYRIPLIETLINWEKPDEAAHGK